MKNLRIALIGLHNHYHAVPFADELQNGVAGMELVAVSDERQALVKDWAEKRGLAWTTDSLGLINRKDVDAVIITSYTSAHADQVEAAWAVVEPVLKGWEKVTPRHFPNYTAGSEGPIAANDLLARDGRSWRRL